ncbi:hypothetical protein [Acaryochloris sp. IP29b_bin.137]|uniref:hypothetical protein n=1 Tax=Acaryochloris sp. IP29b_bin.137 TaxID=2969217 RepID=UPI00262EFE3C|nr:hypothetical protein [Acaryochloris sp. IP29b_bin.137]
MATTLTPLSATPALTDEEILIVIFDGPATHISIDLQRVFSLQTLLMVLPKAASRADNIENSSQ